LYAEVLIRWQHLKFGLITGWFYPFGWRYRDDHSTWLLYLEKGDGSDRSLKKKYLLSRECYHTLGHLYYELMRSTELEKSVLT